MVDAHGDTLDVVTCFRDGHERVVSEVVGTIMSNCGVKHAIEAWHWFHRHQ